MHGEGLVKSTSVSRMTGLCASDATVCTRVPAGMSTASFRGCSRVKMTSADAGEMDLSSNPIRRSSLTTDSLLTAVVMNASAAIRSM